jgi:hypothetical protein
MIEGVPLSDLHLTTGDRKRELRDQREGLATIISERERERDEKFTKRLRGGDHDRERDRL